MSNLQIVEIIVKATTVAAVLALPKKKIVLRSVEAWCVYGGIGRYEVCWPCGGKSLIASDNHGIIKAWANIENAKRLKDANWDFNTPLVHVYDRTGWMVTFPTDD